MSKLLGELLATIKEFFQAISFDIGETSISLSSIFQLIIYFIIVFILVRFLKRFLKQKLLIKLGIDQGNREALANIVSYSLASLLYVVILQSTGFNLSSLTVLAGALGVGIGFGLQDITKNFVSGLTLLIERTVKVGDYVEFDNLEGFVKEISTRSTIITTRDGADVVVPNSQLAENRIINWTYDSAIGRIHVPVAVAYGSDIVLVSETLLKSAYMEPNVLYEPQPKAIFINFGDFSINFELWVWTAKISQKPEIISSLNYIIEFNLRQYGIKIPFPQREVWLRSINSNNFVAERENLSNTIDLNPTHNEQNSNISIRNLLKEVIYFQNFNELELRKLIEIGYRKRLKASQILFHENDPGDAFYIILSGSVEVFVKKINKYLTTLEVGKFFGELSLMLGIPRTATVRAIEDTILFSINKTNFQKLLQEYPDLYDVIVQELSQHQAELKQRQRQLQDMGLLEKDEAEINVILWMRQRLKKIFNLRLND